MAADPRTRTPQSRRDRPAKPPLTRTGIINAGLAILQDEGLGKVTMRRVASALDTGPASLYVYVRDTADLHAQILDALLAHLPRPAKAGGWRERLHEVLESYAQILLAHPEIARMTMTTHPIGAHYFALVEAILDLLAEGDIPDETAAWGVDILLAAVTASAVEHAATAATRIDTESLATMAAAIAVAPDERYPRIVRMGDEMLSGTGIERFHWSLDVVINGLIHTRRAVAVVDQRRASAVGVQPTA